MIRIVLLNVILLLLPTIAYVAYAHLTATDTTVSLNRILKRAPLPWLVIAGAVLAISVMLIFAKPPQGHPGDRYTPPEFRDGKIIPGHLGDKNTKTDDAGKTD